MNLSSADAASQVSVASMVTAIVGIVLQIVGGVDYPTIPPGPIALGVAAGLVAFTRWSWVPFVAVFVPLFLLVGGTIALSVQGWENHGEALPLVGTILQAIGVVVALAAGIQLLRQRHTWSSHAV